MREKKEKRTKIVAVFAAVMLIVALIVGMVSCSSGKATDPTDSTGEQLEHYPVGIVTKPTGDGNEESEPTNGNEATEPSVGTDNGGGVTEPIESKPEPSTGNGNGEVTKPVDTTKPSAPADEKPSDPVKPTEPKPTEPAPTTPKPADPKPTNPKPTEPKPTEPKPTEPKPTEPKPTEPPVTEPPVTEPAPTVHSHSFTVGRTVPATCTVDGYTEYTCSCGETKRDTIPATGHSYDSGRVTTPATCQSEGIKTYSCCTCGNSYTESIPTSEHNWVHHHEDAEGYKERGLQCHCGWVCWESEAKAAGYDIISYYQLFHVNQVCKTPDDLNRHSYYNISRWVETKPAIDYDECSTCGTRK